VKKENSSNTAQKEAAVTAAEEALKAQKYLVEHLEKQLAACTVKAPSDGLVVYGSTGSNYYWRERPIQAGAQINQQELLIRLPDTSKMKASVKVPESWIGKLRDYEKHPMTAKVEIVGVREPVTAKVTSVSVMADNSQRWWTDAKEYPVELTLDTTPPSLKPGISATATIFVEKLPEVLAVPLTTVYSVGADRYVFVKERGQATRPVKVTLGQSNDTHVEIKEGISRGQELLVLQVGQGRELLEKAGINVSDGPGGGAGATTKPSEKQPGTPAVAAAR
jgi:multidrug efflux pump subunit AcrA (membrane-fusion protein)